MILAYTIGNKKGYDSYLKTHSNPEKIGRCYLEDEYYSGGCCWPNYSETREYIEKNKSEIPYEANVYGILLPNSWEQDTDDDTYEEKGYYSLLVDSKLVFVDEDGKRKDIE